MASSFVLEIVLGLLGALSSLLTAIFGFLLNRHMKQVDELQDQLLKHRDEHAAFRLKVAEEYVRAEVVNASLDRIFGKLDEIQRSLANKQDRQG